MTNQPTPQETIDMIKTEKCQCNGKFVCLRCMSLRLCKKMYKDCCVMREAGQKYDSIILEAVEHDAWGRMLQASNEYRQALSQVSDYPATSNG